jgi:hypothetical protein
MDRVRNFMKGDLGLFFVSSRDQKYYGLTVVSPREYIRDRNRELPVGKSEGIITRNRDRGGKDRLAVSLGMRKQNSKRPRPMPLFQNGPVRTGFCLYRLGESKSLVSLPPGRGGGTYKTQQPFCRCPSCRRINRPVSTSSRKCPGRHRWLL